MQPKHLALVLLVMVLYGSAYPVGKIGTLDAPPMFLAAMRVLCVFLFFLPFFQFKLPPSRLFLPLLGFSLSMGVCTYAFMYYALSFTSLVAPIVIGAQLAIPFGLILSLIFLNEKVSFFKWILILTSFIGIIVIAYDPAFIDERIALIFCILMAFFYASANMMARYLNEIDTSVLNGWCNFFAFFPLLIGSIFFDGNTLTIIIELNLSTILVILHASLIVSVIGHAGMFYLYRFYPVNMVLPFYSLFPIFGIILTYLMFDEVITTQQLIGGFLVIGSVYLIHVENKK